MALVVGLTFPVGHIWAADKTPTTSAPTEKTEPLWELGLGGAVVYLPHYPAAAQNQTQFLPLPFFVYRGKIFRSDEKGFLRGRIIKSEKIELDLSLSGSLPVDSDDNDARAGMEELDWLAEIGSRLQVNLLETGDRSRGARVVFELPIRGVFSTDFSEAPEWQGIIFSPGLAYRNKNISDSGVDVSMSAEAIFASEKLMDYFYEVDPQFVRSNRPAYDADAGYLGARFSLNFRRKIGFRVTAFLNTSVQNYTGSTNSDSPLSLETFNYGVVVGFRLALFQSDNRVRD